MSRPSNTEKRREQIVKGLMKAMAKHGYDGASIQVIAKEAKLTSGLMHYHFKSKQEILIALVQYLSELTIKRLEKISTNANSPSKKLNAFIDAYLARGEGASPKAVAAWVAIGAEAIKQKEVREVYKEAISTRRDQIKSLLNEVLEAHGKTTKNSHIISAGVTSTMEGAFQIASAAPNVLSKGYASKITKKMVEGFILSEPNA